MTRSDRDEFFERLLLLRSRYGASVDDREAVLSIGDVVRYAEAVMTAIELDVEPWLAELDAAELDASDIADGAPVEAVRTESDGPAAHAEREWPAPFPRRRPRGTPAPDPIPQGRSGSPEDDDLRN